jgi:hypothetical protein
LISLLCSSQPFYKLKSLSACRYWWLADFIAKMLSFPSGAKSAAAVDYFDIKELRHRRFPSDGRPPLTVRKLLDFGHFCFCLRGSVAGARALPGRMTRTPSRVVSFARSLEQPPNGVAANGRDSVELLTAA